MTKIIEKPSTPVSKRANIGLYYIKNWKLLYEGIEHVLSQPANKGEWYLTDAFQYMIDHGAKLRVVDVAGWYDAGKLETLLETNLAMLQRGRSNWVGAAHNSTIIEPVYAEDGVKVRDSIIGPNVSIGAGTVIEGSTLSHTIVGEKAQIVSSTLTQSLIGDDTVLENVHGRVTVGDHSEVHSS
jgi:glucose-1-phosphate thymidylyltransferase